MNEQDLDRELKNVDATWRRLEMAVIASGAFSIVAPLALWALTIIF